jgi:dihydrofolate synthase/folylpolyglutamate synthase
LDLAGWLQYIEALHPKSISMGLDRVAEVKNRLGLNPGFPLIVVGGTNGKGSTCAVLESIYHQAGYRVATYSRHICCALTSVSESVRSKLLMKSW